MYYKPQIFVCLRVTGFTAVQFIFMKDLIFGLLQSIKQEQHFKRNQTINTEVYIIC